MAYKFMIYSEKGKPDSLKDRVDLALTLTPTSSQQRPHPSGVVVAAHWYYLADSDDIASLQWDPKVLAYNACTISKNHRRRDSISSQSKLSDWIAPPECVTLTSSINSLQWSSPVLYHDPIAIRESSVQAINRAGSTQSITLGLNLIRKDMDNSTAGFRNIAAYSSLTPGGRITSSSNLKLQVYLVDRSIHVGEIMQSSDLTQPLLPEEFGSASLPPYSVWRLSQASSGAIQLNSEGEPTVESQLPSESLAKSLDDLKRLLTTVEESLAQTREDVKLGQQDVASIRKQFSAMEASAVRTQEDVAKAHKSVAKTQEQVARLDLKVPLAEARSEKLAKSLDQTETHLSAVQRLLQATRTRVAEFDQAIPTMEARTDKVAERLSLTQEELSLVHGTQAAAGETLAALSRRVAVVEEKTERLADTSGNAYDSDRDRRDNSPILFASRPAKTPLYSSGPA